MEGNGQGSQSGEVQKITINPSTKEVSPPEAFLGEHEERIRKRGFTNEPLNRHGEDGSITIQKDKEGNITGTVPEGTKAFLRRVKDSEDGSERAIISYDSREGRQQLLVEFKKYAQEIGVPFEEDKPLEQQSKKVRVIFETFFAMLKRRLSQKENHNNGNRHTPDTEAEPIAWSTGVTPEPEKADIPFFSKDPEPARVPKIAEPAPRNPHWAQELRPRTKDELPRLTDPSPLDAYRIKPIPDSTLSSTQDDDGIPQWLQRPSKHRVQYGAGIAGAVPEAEFDDSSVAVAEPEENVVMPEIPATPTISANETTELEETNLPPLFTEEKVGRFDYEAQRMEKEEQQKQKKDEERRRRWPRVFPLNKKITDALKTTVKLGPTIGLWTAPAQITPPPTYTPDIGPNYTDSAPAFPEKERFIENGVKASHIVEKVPFGAEPGDAVIKEGQSPLYSQETIKLQSGDNIWLVTDQELHKLLPEVDDRDTNVATMMLTSMQVDEKGQRTSRDAARYLPVGFPVRMLSKDALKLIHDINTGQGKPSIAKAQLGELFQTLDSPTYTKGKTSQELEQDAIHAAQLLEKALIAEKLDYQQGKVLNLGSAQGE